MTGFLMTFLVYLAVQAFRLAGCCGITTVTQQVVYVQSTNPPQTNFALPQYPNNQPGVQKAPGGSVNGAYQQSFPPPPPY